MALALALGPACGGGGSTGQPGSKTGKADLDRPAKGDGDDAPEGDEASPAATPRCADGTCLACGSGLCPKGFYCDEKAPGGPACGWLPECAQSASCACVKQALGSSCTCTEGPAGPSVSCP